VSLAKFNGMVADSIPHIYNIFGRSYTMSIGCENGPFAWLTHFRIREASVGASTPVVDWTPEFWTILITLGDFGIREEGGA